MSKIVVQFYAVSDLWGGFRQLYDGRRRIAGGRLSSARTGGELPESRPHATSMSRMDNCNGSALVPARKSSFGVQSPRLFSREALR
jgi:hypothetical protein